MFNFKIPTNLDLPKFEMPNIEISTKTTELSNDVVQAVTDSAYVAVGASVLGFRRAAEATTVARKRVSNLDLPSVDLPKMELPSFDLPTVDLSVPSEWASKAVAAGRETIESAREQASRFGTIPVVKAIDEQAIAIEDRVDTVLDAVDSRLPDPAKFILATTRETVKDGAASVRTLVGLGA